jgi:formylmethanofuran dehydrogenase subunit C
MKGGKIIVKKNAGFKVGHGMSGGEIRIEGDYESLGGGIKGGKINHKGKLVFPKEG